MSPDPHDPQEGPTMREVRRARAEAFEAGRGRSPEEQRRIEEKLCAEYGLTLRPSKDERGRPRKIA